MQSPIRVIPAEDWPLIARSSARVFYRGGAGTTSCVTATGGGATWIDGTASPFQSTISSGATSTTQTVALGTGAAAGQVHWFGTAATTRTVASVTGNTIVYTSSVTTVTNETVGVFGDTYKPAMSMFFNDKKRRIVGLGIMRVGHVSTTHEVHMNLSLWPNTIDGSGNWKPDSTMLDPNAWGTLTATNTSSGAARMYAAMFQDTVVLPVGWGWIMNIYKFVTGVSGQFAAVALTRPQAVLNGAAVVEGRYDGRLSPAVQYLSTTPAAVVAGKTFSDAAAALATRPENMEFWFLCE